MMQPSKWQQFLRTMGNWRPIAWYCAVGVALPALIYWLIFRTLHVETDAQETLLAALGIAGFGAFMWAHNRWG